MEKKCPKCETKQISANVQGMKGTFSLSVKKSNFFINSINSNNYAEIVPYVCPKCGYIEFYAYGIKDTK